MTGLDKAVGEIKGGDSRPQACPIVISVLSSLFFEFVNMT
jgi:hypothetical protein